MAQYNFSENVRNDEFTQNYENFVLGRLLASEPDTEIMFIKSMAVTTNDTHETILKISPMVRKGSQVFPMIDLWSRNTLTPADVDRLQNFVATDAIIRVGTYVNEGGEVTTGKPKVIALIDASRNVFMPSGDKRQAPKEESAE